MVDIARIVLTIVLLVGVYTETGIFTTLFAFLLLLDTEIRYWIKK